MLEMDQIKEIYSNLILVFLAFISPLVGALMTYFGDGLNVLRLQYENERLQAEKNIKEQLPKISSEIGINSKVEKDIIRSIQSLKKNRKIAKNKLSLLNPELQLAYLFISISLSLVLLMFSYVAKNIKIISGVKLFNIDVEGLIFLLSIIIFVFAVHKMWNLFKLVNELIKSDNSQNHEKYQTIVNLLKEMPEATMVKGIYVSFNDKQIKDDKTTMEFKAQEKVDIPISITNSETKMAKSIEVGIVFTLDFLIEKNSSYSIYTTATSQIVRYSQEKINGSENFIFSNITLTPLKKGTYNTKVFIKGENVAVTNRYINIIIS